MIPEESIEFRSYQKDLDESFLYGTWLNNYKYSSYFAKRVRPFIFFKGHRPVIDHLVQKPTTKIIIACPKGDHDTILGYLVCEPNEPSVVHFVFVKDAFRGMGIMRRLLNESKMDLKKLMFTHWTYPVDELINKYPDMIYDPYNL